jgi:hypothetical protein
VFSSAELALASAIVTCQLEQRLSKACVRLDSIAHFHKVSLPCLLGGFCLQPYLCMCVEGNVQVRVDMVWTANGLPDKWAGAHSEAFSHND